MPLSGKLNNRCRGYTKSSPDSATSSMASLAEGERRIPGRATLARQAAQAQEETMSAVFRDSAPVMAPHRKLSVEDYHRMAAVGIFQPEERVELIEGELIDMPPIGHFHAGLANDLNRFFTPCTLGRAVTCMQNPIVLGLHSEPQPDFALLRHRADSYKRALPTAADTLLVVEISDTTLRYDRKIKLPLYARYGIPEYWLISVPERRIEAHLGPEPEQGRYREVRVFTEGLLTPACFPDLALDVAELLS
jgi:Uma2 family endonuclease